MFSPNMSRYVCMCMFLVIYLHLLGSWLQHTGSSLHHAGPFIVDSSCGVGVQTLFGVWDPSFLTKDENCVPCIARQILDHWTTREVPVYVCLTFSSI